MKRPHRRTHFLLWMAIAPITAIAGIIFWQMRPSTPYTDLPPDIEETSDAPSNAAETR